MWFLVIFPLALWLLAAGVAHALGHRNGWRSLWLAAATGAAPVVAVAHLAKAVVKVTSWGGFLPLALHDPAGVETLRQLASKSLSPPGPWTSLSPLGWLMLALVVVMGWRSVRWSQQAAAGNVAAARAGMVVTSLLYSAVLASWPWF